MVGQLNGVTERDWSRKWWVLRAAT